jgi:hypothetical protein
VNPKEVKNYYDVIGNPKDLGTIRKDLKNLKYRTGQAFMEDIKLISENCIRFNSEQHNLSYISKVMVNKAEELLNKHGEKIKELESDIINHERKDSNDKFRVKLKLKPDVIHGKEDASVTNESADLDVEMNDLSQLDSPFERIEEEVNIEE